MARYTILVCDRCEKRYDDPDALVEVTYTIDTRTYRQELDDECIEQIKKRAVETTETGKHREDD